MSYTPHEVLHKYWGYENFRPLQEDIINSVLAGNDTLALLPTGGGKSICFQVPALCLDGLCLVITPLIALMTDQVDNLKKINISAMAIHSGLHSHEVEYALNRCGDGSVKFLYISPERLVSRKFRDYLRFMNISLIAVDEAHCISQWGYDFRPPYLNIANIRELLPNTPIVALTATAVPEVADDIQGKLRFKKKNVFTKSFTRDNLAYIVRKVDDKYKKLLRVCTSVQGCGIIYVRNRKLTKEVSDFLLLNNISATYYHAGLSPKERQKKQHDWMSEKVRIMVATNAFGMGIDKPNVRFVAHIDLPENIEAYYQEAGRAGRDGKKSFAVLIYNNHDIENGRRNVLLSWPEPDTIKNIYQAIGNYLQLPTGSGKDCSFDFELDMFCSHYNFNTYTVFNAIRILERDGYFSTNDSWDEPSKIMFLCSKEDLYYFQLNHQTLDPLIRLILRSYSGVFTGYVRISENDLARRSGINQPKIVQLLKELNNLGIIEYLPQKTKPQLVFITERLNTDMINLSKTFYTNRKQAAIQKFEELVNYAESNTNCRSKLLVKYFGETHAKSCNICDFCLEQKKKGIQQQSLHDIENYLLQLPDNKLIAITDIVKTLTKFHENDILAIIRIMIEDGKLQLQGELIGKNTNSKP